MSVLKFFLDDVRQAFDSRLYRAKLAGRLALGIVPPPPGFLQTLYIQPTNVCNCQCVFCAYRKMKKTGSFGRTMDAATFACVLYRFKSAGGSVIRLVPTVGEIFLDPGVFEKIAHAKREGFSVTAFTNGLLLTRHAAQLAGSGLDALDISIGDILPEHESVIFGISQVAARQKIDGILALLKQVEEQGSHMKLALHFRPSRRRASLWRDFARSGFMRPYREGRLAVHWGYRYDNWCGQIAQSELLGRMRLRRNPKLWRLPCANFQKATVLPNGDLRLCGCRCKETLQDELIVGNLLTQSVNEIRESEKHKGLLARYAQGDLPDVCRECSLYEPFG